MGFGYSFHGKPLVKVDWGNLATTNTNFLQNARVFVDSGLGRGNAQEVSRIRQQLAIGLVQTNGTPLAEIARHVGVSTSAISKVLSRVREH